MKWMKRVLRRWGWVKIEPVKLRGMSEEQVLSALAMGPEAPAFQALMVLLEEAIAGANAVGQSPQVARDHGMLAFYAGGAGHLEMFRDGLMARRQKALPRDEA